MNCTSIALASTRPRWSSTSTPTVTPCPVDLGLHAINDGALVLFDATDGANGRHLGQRRNRERNARPSDRSKPSLHGRGLDGLLFRSPTNDLLWTNGSDLRTWTALPIWTTAQQQAGPQPLRTEPVRSSMASHRPARRLVQRLDTNGDVEPYRLDLDGTVTAWSVNV